MNILRTIRTFIVNRPFLSIAIIVMAIFGFIFIFLGSLSLFFKFIAKRPLFYFGIYILSVIIFSCVYWIYIKTKDRKIDSITFNQVVRDISHIIRNVILLLVSIYMATYMITQIITVYFNNYNTRYNMGGQGNIFNVYTGPYNITELPKKIGMSRQEQADIEMASSEKTIEAEEAYLAEGQRPIKTKISRAALAKKQIIEVPNIYLSQEYPSSQGYNYRQNINLSDGISAVMNLKDGEQPIWFGVVNRGLRNIDNPVLFLHFEGDFDIKVAPDKSIGWSTMEPNKEFNIRIASSLQPSSGFKLHPLIVNFKTAGVYKARYTITSDNNLPKSGDFTIKVVAP